MKRTLDRRGSDADARHDVSTRRARGATVSNAASIRHVAVLALAACMLLGSACAVADALEPPVKLSRSGICHERGAPFYAKTTNYTPYPTLDTCLRAGGRLPRGVKPLSEPGVAPALIASPGNASRSPSEPATDAVAASPDRFRTLLENEHVRVLEYTLRPGERDQWHTHPPKVSYVVRGGKLRIHLADGSAFDADETAGTAAWMEAVPRHYAENVGKTPVTIVLTEVKSAAIDAGDDERRVVDAIEAFFAAAAIGDLAKVHAVVTPDFYAFEVGRRFTGDELMTVLRDKQASGTAYVWNVTEPTVRIDGRTAWVTYTNRGSITDSSGRKEMRWLESVVLQKDDGGWRMRFLHSTRVP